MNRSLCLWVVYTYIIFPIYPIQSFAQDTGVVVYGKVHASIDAIDDGQKENTNISNNSSRIGFRGSSDLIRDLKGLWQLESEIDVSGESGTLTARNRYVGLSGDIGTLLLGIHDTPFKSIARSVDIFNETIADSRAILGSVNASGDVFNLRAKNAVLYKSPKINGVQFKALYSADYDGSGAASVDSKTKELTSASLEFDQGLLRLAAGYENRRNESGIRIVARIKSESIFTSFIYEVLENDVGGTIFDREAFAFNVAYHVGLVSLAISYAIADDNEIAKETGAELLSVGVFQSLSKSVRIYLAVASTSNGENGNYLLASGDHGDRIVPFAAGDKASAASLGFIQRF